MRYFHEFMEKVKEIGGLLEKRNEWRVRKCDLNQDSMREMNELEGD